MVSINPLAVMDLENNEGGKTVAEHDEKEMSAEDLEEQNGEPLPDREAMSLITPPGADGIGAIAPVEPPSEA